VREREYREYGEIQRYTERRKRDWQTLKLVDNIIYKCVCACVPVCVFVSVCMCVCVYVCVYVCVCVKSESIESCRATEREKR
jgi:hypothetical protein